MLLSHPYHSFTETTVTELRDYPEWHHGRSRYAIWVIPISCPLLLDYIDKLTGQLADLVHTSRRQPHITVFVCGFEQDRIVMNDDFTAAQLQQQIVDLNKLRLPPCSLQIGRPDSFSSAAFLPVIDQSGHLEAWRGALADSCTEIRQTSYIPHITLGLYRQRVSAELLRQRLNQLPELDDLSLRVEQLEYATYSSTDLLGALEYRQQVAC